jgi:predicted GTPase
MSISASMEKSFMEQSVEGVSRQNLILGWLSVLAPSFKHSAFRDESEWRLVLTKPYKTMPGQRFRAGKSTVVPFVEVELNKDLNKKPFDSCMIREVVVGPTPNIDLSIDAVRFLLQSHDRNEVLVERSAIPYRHW